MDLEPCAISVKLGNYLGNFGNFGDFGNISVQLQTLKMQLKKKLKAGVLPLRWIGINLLIHWFIGSYILLLEICQAMEVFQDMIV